MLFLGLCFYYTAAVVAGRLKFLRLPSGYRTLCIYLLLPPACLALNLLSGYPGLYALPLLLCTALVTYQATKEVTLRRKFLKREGVGRIG